MTSEVVFLLQDSAKSRGASGLKSVQNANAGNAPKGDQLGVDRDIDAAQLVHTDGDASDEALLNEVRCGSADALAALFRRHAGVLRSIALRILRNEEEADDLVQEFFLFVFRKASLFDPERGTGRSWLIQIAYHRSFDRRRHLNARRFYTNLELDESVLHDAVPAFSGTAYEKTIQGALGLATITRIETSLSDIQRRVVQLHFVEGNSLQEIAEIVGQTVGNVRNHYYRALEKMRREIFDRKLQEK